MSAATDRRPTKGAPAELCSPPSLSAPVWPIRKAIANALRLHLSASEKRPCRRQTRPRPTRRGSGHSDNPGHRLATLPNRNTSIVLILQGSWAVVTPPDPPHQPQRPQWRNAPGRGPWERTRAWTNSPSGANPTRDALAQAEGQYDVSRVGDLAPDLASPSVGPLLDRP